MIWNKLINWLLKLSKTSPILKQAGYIIYFLPMLAIYFLLQFSALRGFHCHSLNAKFLLNNDEISPKEVPLQDQLEYFEFSLNVHYSRQPEKVRFLCLRYFFSPMTINVRFIKLKRIPYPNFTKKLVWIKTDALGEIKIWTPKTI